MKRYKSKFNPGDVVKDAIGDYYIVHGSSAFLLDSTPEPEDFKEYSLYTVEDGIITNEIAWEDEEDYTLVKRANFNSWKLITDFLNKDL